MSDGHIIRFFVVYFSDPAKKGKALPLRPVPGDGGGGGGHLTSRAQQRYSGASPGCPTARLPAAPARMARRPLLISPPKIIMYNSWLGFLYRLRPHRQWALRVLIHEIVRGRLELPPEDRNCKSAARRSFLMLCALASHASVRKCSLRQCPSPDVATVTVPVLPRRPSPAAYLKPAIPAPLSNPASYMLTPVETPLSCRNVSLETLCLLLPRQLTLQLDSSIQRQTLNTLEILVCSTSNTGTVPPVR